MNRQLIVVATAICMFSISSHADTHAQNELVRKANQRAKVQAKKDYKVRQERKASASKANKVVSEVTLKPSSIVQAENSGIISCVSCVEKLRNEPNSNSMRNLTSMAKAMNKKMKAMGIEKLADIESSGLALSLIRDAGVETLAKRTKISVAKAEVLFETMVSAPNDIFSESFSESKIKQLRAQAYRNTRSVSADVGGTK